MNKATTLSQQTAENAEMRNVVQVYWNHGYSEQGGISSITYC